MNFTSNMENLDKQNSNLNNDLFWIISAGDPAGASPELIPHLLKNHIKEETLVIAGPRTVQNKVCPELEISTDPFSDKKDCWYPTGKFNSEDVLSGQPDRKSGKAAIIAFKEALQLLKTDQADGLLTLPLAKNAVQAAGYPDFTGHTEYVEKFFHREGLMSFFGDKFNCSLLSRHIPLQRVTEYITTKLIIEKVEICAKFFQRSGIASPRFALLGLNPHAGEEGNLGDEDDMILQPAIKKLQEKNINISGPHPADSFIPVEGENTDMIFSCYHDQGLTAFKQLHFFTGVHATLGLGTARVSPVHGTAASLAGTGQIDPRSVINCLKWLRKWKENSA